MQYLEIYVKENNLLQLPLFYFQKANLAYISHEWTQNGINYKVVCDCRLGLPGAFEQDVYTACMRIWVRAGMPEDGIDTNYSEIAREMKMSARDNNQRIKTAIEKLAKARYRLTGCFLYKKKEGVVREDYDFSLFTEAEIFTWRKGRSKKKNRSLLLFPTKIKNNLQAKYYQKLDMVWYRALPYGLPRRLYEYLDKRRYHNVNGVFTISEEAICIWLPIKDRNVTQRRHSLRKTAQALIDVGYLKHDGYSFDKKRKLCHYTYASNASPKKDVPIIIDQPPESQPPKVALLATVPTPAPTEADQMTFVDALDWLNTIPYFQNKRKRKLASLPFSTVAKLYPGIRAEYERKTQEDKRPRPSWVYQEFMGAPAKKIKQAPPTDRPVPETETLDDLLRLLKIPKPTKKLCRVIEEHLQEKSYEYAKWSILYANKQVKNEPVRTFSRRYSVYLQKALRENYAEEWQEEERNRIEAEKERREEEERKREKARQREEAQRQEEKEKPVFLAAVADLPEKVKMEIWEKAEGAVPVDQAGRKLHIKIKYLQGLWECLADKGEKFNVAVSVDMGLARRMERPGLRYG